MARPELAAIFARPIAHRGLHDRNQGRIENAPAAFAAAIEAGFGIECDLQLSADGEAMVFHDFVLDRLTLEEGPVEAWPAAKLRAVALRESHDRIGTLADLLAQVAGRVPLVVEVKSRHDGKTSIAPRVADLVAGYAGPLVLKSFDPAMIVALRALGVKQPLGIVGMSNYDYPDYARLSAAEKHALANLLHYEATRPDFLSWHHRDLPSAVPHLCRVALGLPVMSWTIRSAAEAARARPHLDQIVFEGYRPD